jgi:hypothetical protein
VLHRAQKVLASIGRDEWILHLSYPLRLLTFFGVPNAAILPSRICGVVDQRPPSDHETEKSVREVCHNCGGTDTILISRFPWDGSTHLNWRCSKCDHVWVTPERRKERP